MRGELWEFAASPGGSVTVAVVQTDALNDVAPTTVGVVVTHRAQRAGEPLAIELDPAESGLGRRAWVKTTQLRTLALADARRRVGHLPPETLARVEAALRQVLDLG